MCPSGYFYTVIIIIIIVKPSQQNCPEEVSQTGIKVQWCESPEASNVESDPQCYNNETLVTRNCTNMGWIPTLDRLEPCYKIVKHINTLSCPPGFKKLSPNLNKYCYQVREPSTWNHPCLETGGATVISELTENEIESLLTSLNSSEYHYFWLPARREKILAPVVWHIPGSNWGQIVTNVEHIPLKASILKNCLLFDTLKRSLITENCNEVYPSLCFYINDLNIPAKCPEGYFAFRHILDEVKCFGIEKSDTHLTYEEFSKTRCQTPMGNDNKSELTAFVFSKIAESSYLPSTEWCWFSNYFEHNSDSISTAIAEVELIPRWRNAINNMGNIMLLDSSQRLACMACETNIRYDETELIFEYSPNEKKIYLTVYSPSGLWKYNNDDKGIQCFSDAKGFFKVIDVCESIPQVNFKSIDSETLHTEKNTFIIDLVTDRSARYWCEGHTKNFSLITTKKIIVNPHGNNVHVFSLVLVTLFNLNEGDNVIQLQINELINIISSIFQAEKVILMDVLDYNSENYVKVLLHLHIPINNTYSDKSLNLLNTYKSLKEKVIDEFPKYDYTFVNMSSSVYCLATTSQDSIILKWDITPIGYITSPKQFCLQSNGLPVYRYCHGSYLLGSFWGEVIGKCDKSFTPSVATTLLFNFVQGNMADQFASQFLTVGLEFVFNDTNIIIPADIYYLSLSFQQILHIASVNATSIETDIENIAWIMDRIMVLDKNSLHLSQTLNSTNVILDSINNFITMITEQKLQPTKLNGRSITINDSYHLAVQPRFVIQISHPEISNITGIAIINERNSESFSDMRIQPLYKNITLEDVLAIKHLEVATWLPRVVLDTLEQGNNETNDSDEISSMRIVINVYYNDVIFQELNTNKYKINSRIIEVAVPGYSTSPLFSVPLLFGQIFETNLPSMCGYWDFHSEVGNISGSWLNRGCSLLANINNITVCECYHLTHFGQLINVNGIDDQVIEERHRKALNMITIIGSSLSLLGIVGIWITAIVFDMWRRKTGTKVLLQLSTAIALPLVLIILFNLDDSLLASVHNNEELPCNKQIFCIILGALFHYSVLANFMWMLIAAVLQFIRYVRVLGVSRPSRFMFKITVLGWGLPLIPVTILLIVDRKNYIPSPEMMRPICYPSGIYMLVGVVVPVCIILIINIILFLLVIKSISKKSEMRITDKSLVYAQLRLSIFLFFLLGLTWVFGVMSFSGSVTCSYLFCLTGTVQGFVMFVYFVICDPTTRNLWITMMKPQFVMTSRNSITTISSE